MKVTWNAYEVGGNVSKNLEIFSPKYFFIRRALPWRKSSGVTCFLQRMRNNIRKSKGQDFHYKWPNPSLPWEKFKDETWCFWYYVEPWSKFLFFFFPRSFFFDKGRLDFLNKINAYGRHRLFWCQSRHCSFLSY